MNNFKRNIFILIGIIIGLINLWDGIWAMFVFSNDTKIFDWIFVYTGLISFLPCVIIGIFWRKLAATLLIILAIIYLFSVILNPQICQNFKIIIYYLVRYFLPMLAYGIVLLFLKKPQAV